MATGKDQNTSRPRKAARVKPLDAPRRRGSPLLPAALLVLVIAGLLALGVLTPASAPEAAGDAFAPLAEAEDAVRLNEVMASNVMTLTLADGSRPDWVELKNTGRASAWLGGYVLMSGSDGENMFRFPAVELPAGATLLLYADNRGGDGGLHLPYKLSASGETLTLLNASGDAVDRVTTPKLEGDEAYARAASGAWEVTCAATPGRENEIVSPGSEEALSRVVPTQASGAVIVTEVASRNVTYAPDAGGAAADYVEVANVSASAVSLEGWHLSDDKLNLAKWTFPALTLQPGEYQIVYCSGVDSHDDVHDLHANFRLSGHGESVILTARDGSVAAMVAVPALNPDQAYSLADGVWTDQLAPTPRAANTQENAWAIGNSVLAASGSALRINEICATATAEAPDWIELYNAGPETVSLEGYALSDNPKNPQKWRFPAGTTVGPGQYTGVLCSGLDTVKNGRMHTNFKLSSAGGCSLVLSGPGGQLLDRVFLPRLYEGLSYGRVEGREGFYVFSSDTPMSANATTAYAGKLSAPHYSVSGGLYTGGETLSVELTAPAGAHIFYTLDCTDPTEASPLYTGPLTITGNTILRTRVYMNGYLESNIDTQSYLFDVHTEPGVYVVSLVSDPNNLTSDEQGIMVRGSGTKPNYRQDWERPASVELFTAEGERVINQACGIGLHGGGSRKLPIKSFNVIARGIYGKNSFDYPIFRERGYASYKSFLLRPSGEDYNLSFMRDTLLTSLMGDSTVLYQKWELAVTYLNGQYYTLDYLRERISAASICQFEGWEGMEDDIDIVREELYATQGSDATFQDLLSWCKKNDTASEEAFAYLDSQIDVQSYIEYMTAEIFTGNTDLLNVRRYRNARADGKWHWALYDLDWAFFNDTNSIKSWMNPRGAGANNAADTTLFISCMKNPVFRDRYLTYFGEMLATSFSTQNVLERIQERYNLIQPFRAEYEARWDIDLEPGIRTLVQYAKDRPAKIIRYMQAELDLSDADLQKYFGAAIAQITGASSQG